MRRRLALCLLIGLAGCRGPGRGVVCPGEPVCMPPPSAPCPPPVHVKVPPQHIEVNIKREKEKPAGPEEQRAPERQPIAQEVILVPRTVYVPYVQQTPVGPMRMMTTGAVVPPQEQRVPPQEQKAPPQEQRVPVPCVPCPPPAPCPPRHFVAPNCRVDVGSFPQSPPSQGGDTEGVGGVEALNQRLDRLESAVTQMVQFQIEASRAQPRPAARPVEMPPLPVIPASAPGPELHLEPHPSRAP